MVLEIHDLYYDDQRDIILVNDGEIFVDMKDKHNVNISSSNKEYTEAQLKEFGNELMEMLQAHIKNIEDDMSIWQKLKYWLKGNLWN